MSDSDHAGWVIELDDVGAPGSQALLLEHFVESSNRRCRHAEGRGCTDEEIETGFARVRTDDLAPPTGVFLVAHRADDDTVLGGCVGLRLTRGASGARVADARRLHVRPELRGSGLGASLLLTAEEVARVWGVEAIRLSTRRDLAESGSFLAADDGWAEVAPFSDDPDADVWYAKPL